MCLQGLAITAFQVVLVQMVMGFCQNPAPALSSPVRLQGLAISTFQVVLVPMVLGFCQNPAPALSSPVRLQGLAISTFQVVLVPTVLGVLTNELAPGFVRALKPVLPLIGVALTTLLCASPCAQVASILKCALAFLNKNPRVNP